MIGFSQTKRISKWERITADERSAEKFYKFEAQSYSLKASNKRRGKMAYRETIKNEELKAYLRGAEFFWNITADVGWGCPNHWADVMLVQYLLGTALDWREMSPKVDGAFGPKTNNILKLVQKDFL